MATRRRHPRRRQTRRSHQQSGGGREEDFDVIRSVYRNIHNQGGLIAAIYNTREIYNSNSCRDAAPKSQLGYNGHRETSIPDKYTRPDYDKKPLNTVIRCAFNFFNKYASEYRGEEGGYEELEQAAKINNQLRVIFRTLVDGDPVMATSGGAIKKAEKLFNSIRDHMGRASRSPIAGAANVVKEHTKAAERREKERGREARAAAATIAERAAAAAAAAEEAAAAAYKAAAAAERFGTNLYTARRNWEYAHRHNAAAAGGAGNHRYSPLPGVWGKTPSSSPM